MTTTETTTSYSLTTKTLAIIGFVATLFLIIWLCIKAFALIPSAFTSLASIANKIDSYAPKATLTLTSLKEVMNSGESTKLTWEDMQQVGEYSLSYTCVDGTTVVLTRNNETPTQLSCTEVMKFPTPEDAVTVEIKTLKERFTDVVFTLSFTGTKKDFTLSDTTTIRVANASIPVQETPQPEVTPPVKEEVTEVEPAPREDTPVRPTPQPIIRYVYPTSNPNGYTDLRVTTTGVGKMILGSFIPTASYDSDVINAIKVRVQNIGTKTSDVWSFKSKLPNGDVYTSDEEAPLKPQEFVEFTIGFSITEKNGNVYVTSSIENDTDTNSKNDTSKWYVRVQN